MVRSQYPTWFYYLHWEILHGTAKLSSLVIALAVNQMFAPFLLAIVLFFSKSRVVHYIGLGLLFAIALIHYGRASIN
jgi:hypothetical protein